MKRMFDLIVSLVLLLMLGPLMLLLALLIRRQLGNPVLFVQPRPGLDGKVFHLYKFRSMTSGVDDSGQLLPDEQRLPPFGQWLRSTSLDELPSLLNTLKGEMSFVGPRPLLVEYLPLYNSMQARRHDVKPGLTGWAQINGRNAQTWRQRFELDVWYVDNQSFLLDCRILMLTVTKVIKREGVSADGHVTMERFRGDE